MTRMRVFTRDGSGLPRFVAHHPGAVLCMALSPDGRILATGGEEPGKVRLWSTEWMGCLGDVTLSAMGYEIGFRTRHAYDEPTYDTLPRFVTALDWSPDGRRLVAACAGYMFVIGATSRCVLRWIGPQKGQICGAKWLTNRVVGSVCYDCKQRNWVADRKKKVEQPGRTVPVAVSRPRTFVPSPDNSAAFVGGADGGAVMVLDMTQGVSLRTPVHGIEAAGWGVDGRTIYTVDYGGRLRLFDAGGYCVAPEVELHGTMVRCMAKPRDSSIAATGDEDGLVKVWHEDLGVLAELQGHAGAVRCAAAAPRFEAVYSAGEDGVIRCWLDLPIDRALREARAKIVMDEPRLPPEGERNLEV